MKSPTTTASLLAEDAPVASHDSTSAFAETLDPLLHQPLRTQIAAYLVGRGEQATCGRGGSFSFRKKSLSRRPTLRRPLLFQ